MRAVAQVANPEATEIALTVTISYRNARALIDQLSADKYPASEFASLIRRALGETVERASVAREVEA